VNKLHSKDGLEPTWNFRKVFRQSKT